MENYMEQVQIFKNMLTILVITHREEKRNE